MTFQRGQAMTEFAIAAVVLALVLLGSATLAGLQRVDRRAQLIAREVAFSGAWSGNPAPARELAARHAGDAALVDGHGRALLQADDAVGLTAAMAPPPGHAAIAGTAMLAPLRAAGGFLGADFDLTAHGYRTGRISARATTSAALPAPFSRLQLEMQSRYAILDDAWHAAGAAHVRRRAAGLVPTSTLQGWSVLWRPLAVPLSLLEPSLRDYCPGLIEPDRIPEDRLGPGRTALPRGCP